MSNPSKAAIECAMINYWGHGWREDYGDRHLQYLRNHQEDDYKEVMECAALIDKAVKPIIEAANNALNYLPAKDGKRIPGDPDGDVQLMICNSLKTALRDWRSDGC